MTAGTTLMGSTPQMRADARIFDRDLSTAFLVTLPLPVSARSAIALLSSARVIGVSSAPASANNSRRPKSRVSSSSAARLTDARCLCPTAENHHRARRRYGQIGAQTQQLRQLGVTARREPIGQTFGCGTARRGCHVFRSSGIRLETWSVRRNGVLSK